ncbi:MAG: hypothetical protein V4772_15640 [Pseudomonadota bacterium]
MLATPAPALPAAPSAGNTPPQSVTRTGNVPGGLSGSPAGATAGPAGAVGSPAGSQGSPAAGTSPSVQGAATDVPRAPLDLSLPRPQPSFPYRPPMAAPQRSLSEMANEQLRRKPRDPFAEAVNSAGHIDCLKEAPDGPAQGLLAIGPLLKRAVDEKCKK